MRTSQTFWSASSFVSGECLDEPNAKFSAPFPEHSHVKTDVVANSLGVPFISSCVPVLSSGTITLCLQGGGGQSH